MDDILELLFGLFILAMIFVVGFAIYHLVLEFWPYLLAFVVVFGMIFICAMNVISKNKEGKKRFQLQQELEASKREQEKAEIHVNLKREQELDKKISVTNDYLNTNLEREYQKSFVTYWLGTTLAKFPIKKLTDELYQDVFNINSSKLLAEYSTAIFQSVYDEWYRDFHPEISFDDIKDNAEEYAGGTSEKLSILELYTSYIALEMLNMMTVNHALQKEMVIFINRLFNDDNHKNYEDSFRERKILKTGSEYVLSKKIAFLLMSVFYLNREGMRIKGRTQKRKKQDDDIDSILSDIENIKDEIIKNQDFYEYLQKSKQGSDDLIRFVEIEISKLDAGDPEFLEKANAIMDAIDNELGDK